MANILWKKVKKLVVSEKKENNGKLTDEEIRRKALDAEKEKATLNSEPWVAVIDTQVNPKNIRNGFFELDWNNEFIEQLLDAGYKGESAEEIVDAWFKSVVREMLEEEDLGQEFSPTSAGYINVVPINKGKSEVS